jgi:acetyltransferase-like isoleucine patch superfamily enzyme
MLDSDLIEDKALIERMQDARVSAAQKYLNMFVGKSSIRELLKYEILISYLTLLPGAAGFFLRGKLFKYIFKEVGSHAFFGRSLTVRCPSRISIGSNVIIDDNTVLDAKGHPDKSYINIGNDVLIGRNGILSCTNAHIEFGDFVSTGPNCYFTTKSFITIGSDVSIGPNTHIIGASHEYHDLDTPIIKQKRISKGIVVEDNVWIGAGAIIFDGVCIGKGTIVGAGAIVNCDIPPYSIAVGSPAKVIRDRREIDDD